MRRCEECARRPHPSWVIRCTHLRPDNGDQAGSTTVAGILDSWCRDWVETLGFVGVPAVPTVNRLGAWLHAHLEVACDRHEAISDFAREIRTLLVAERRAIGRDLAPTRYEAPCPYCRTKSLRRAPGGDWIECAGRDGCGRLWGEDEYGLLARAAIADDELLMTSEAATLARVEPSTVRSWATRGRLVAAEYDEDGRPWYRKGDVQALSEGIAA